MKQVTKWEAEDGREFSDPDDCMIHEKRCGKAKLIMLALPPRPVGCDYANGGGYIQHSHEPFMKARREFLEFVQANYTRHKWIQQSIDKGLGVHPSYASRIISDCCPASISSHWYRFVCTDNQFREWGQPYYAEHPGEATARCLNPTDLQTIAREEQERALREREDQRGVKL